MTITLRGTKGSRLTHAELDANFTDLQSADTAAAAALAASSGSSLVGFIQSGTGAVATTVQSRIRAGKPLLIDFIPVALHSEISARTLTTDLTDYITDALDEMVARGGGTVEAPLGLLIVEGVIAIPDGVNLIGFGNHQDEDVATEFRLADAAAKITFGGLGSINGQRGGVSGNFVVNADDVAEQPFYVGRAVHRTFQSIDINSSVEEALLIQEAQNNIFMGVNVNFAGTDGIVLDVGAGGNSFLRVEIDAPEECAVRIKESLGTGPYAIPTHNGFYHCIFERTVDGPILHHGAGNLNSFDKCIFSSGENLVDTFSIIKVTQDGAPSSANLKLNDCQISGVNLSLASALEVANGCSVYLTGKTLIAGVAHAFNIATGATIDIQGSYELSGTVANAFTGTGAQDTVIRSSRLTPQRVTRTATGDLVLIADVAGDAVARFRLAANGSMTWGDGTNAVDVNLFRSTTDLLRTSDTFRALVLQTEQGGSGTALPAIATASRNTTAVGNVGTGEDNLMTYAMPANAFSVITKGVRITAWGTAANNGNAKTLKLYFGSAIFTVSLTISQANKWRVVAEVFSTSTASDAQDYAVSFFQKGTVEIHDLANGSTTEDEESAITIKCTGEATDNNDIVQEGMFVEFMS